MAGMAVFWGCIAYRNVAVHDDLVNISKDLATNVLATCLLVVKDAGRGRLTSGRNELSISRNRIGGTYKDDDTKATSRKEQVDPVLNLVDLDVVSWRNDTSLVQATVELNNDLPGTVIVNNLELANVACPLEDMSVECCESLNDRRHVWNQRTCKILSQSYLSAT